MTFDHFDVSRDNQPMNQSLRAGLIRRSQLAILGALGNGASGGPTNNSEVATNASPIAASATPTFISTGFTSKTGTVLVIAEMTVESGGGASLAAGDAVTFQVALDLGLSGVQQVGVAATGTGAVVSAHATVSTILTVTPNTVHDIGIGASVGGGHTAQVATNMAGVTIVDL